MATISVKDNQSIIDMAIQHCGSAEAAFDLAALNGLSITDKLVPGQTLILPDVVNRNIVEYYAGKGIVPTTDLDQVVDIKTFDESHGLTFY